MYLIQTLVLWLAPKMLLGGSGNSASWNSFSSCCIIEQKLNTLLNTVGFTFSWALEAAPPKDAWLSTYQRLVCSCWKPMFNRVAVVGFLFCFWCWTKEFDCSRRKTFPPAYRWFLTDAVGVLVDLCWTNQISTDIVAVVDTVLQLNTILSNATALLI